MTLCIKNPKPMYGCRKNLCKVYTTILQKYLPYQKNIQGFIAYPQLLTMQIRKGKLHQQSLQFHSNLNLSLQYSLQRFNLRFQCMCQLRPINIRLSNLTEKRGKINCSTLLLLVTELTYAELSLSGLTPNLFPHSQAPTHQQTPDLSLLHHLHRPSSLFLCPSPFPTIASPTLPNQNSHHPCITHLCIKPSDMLFLFAYIWIHTQLFMLIYAKNFSFDSKIKHRYS